MSAHAGELPETKPFNSEQISRLSTSLDQIDSNMRILQDRRVYLQGQLSAIDPGAAKGADSASANPRIRLQRLRKEQANLRTKYSEKHPDVVRIKRQIQELEQQLSASEDYNKKSAQLEELKSKLTPLKASLGPNHPDVVKLSDEISALSGELASKKVHEYPSNRLTVRRQPGLCKSEDSARHDGDGDQKSDRTEERDAEENRQLLQKERTDHDH